TGQHWAELATELSGALTLTAETNRFGIFAFVHQPNRGTFWPSIAPVGVTIARWGGGPISLLPRATSFWVTVDGHFIGYVPGAPSFVNERFVAEFPGEVLPACQWMIVARR